jgi:protein arginine kinase activator
MNGARCQICQQQVAKIHITQIHGDQLVEIHVCPECAQNNGLSGPVLKVNLSVEGLLSGAVADEQGTRAEPLSDSKSCPVCGQTFRGFRESGRLGCRHCYEAFSEDLVPLLRKVQMGLVHHGKSPAGEKMAPSPVADIQRKRENLRVAVAQEDFELAARLRDEIRLLEEDSKG